MTQKTSSILIGLVATALASVQAGMTADALAALAIKQNPEVNFYRAEIAAAKGGLRTAGTIANPELSTHAGYKNALESGKLTGEGSAFSLSLGQPLEYPGRIALRKAIANRDIRLAELRLEQFKAMLAARVRTLAYGISSAHERSAAAREVAGRFQAVSDVLAQRPTAGVTPQLEARIVRTNMLTFRRQEREAALTEATMTAELNQLCGRPPNAPLAVNAGTVSFSPASVPNLLNAARSNAFEIRIREVELAQQGVKVALSKNERYPAVSIGPYFSREQAADTEYQAGIGISVPLPFWNRNVGNIETSKARAEQAQASLITADREVQRRVTQSVAILEAKRTEIENLKADEVAKFREAAELADRNYRLGAVPLAIFIETQKQYLELVTAVNDLQKDALQAAQELEILTGLKLYKGEQQP